MSYELKILWVGTGHLATLTSMLRTQKNVCLSLQKGKNLRESTDEILLPGSSSCVSLI